MSGRPFRAKIYMLDGGGVNEKDSAPLKRADDMETYRR